MSSPQPYRNSAGRVVFPSPGSKTPESGWPHAPLSPEEIIDAGGNPEDWGIDAPELPAEVAPSLFDEPEMYEDVEDD